MDRYDCEGYTLVGSGGLATPVLAACAVSTENEVATVLVPELEITNAEKKVQFRDVAILTFLWKQCRVKLGGYNF